MSKSHDPNAEIEAIGIDNERNERSLLRKLDRRLLPAVGVLYLLSFLDRSNGRLAQMLLFRNSANLSQLGMPVLRAWSMTCI